MCVLTLSGCADNRTLSGSPIANEIAGEGFGSDSCAADHHGKTCALADFKGWAGLLRAALSVRGRYLQLLINHSAEIAAIVHDVVLLGEKLMTTVVRLMPSESALARVADKHVCSQVTCNDCGIYGLCYEVNGPDVDLSLPETIVRNRKLFKRGELLYRAGEPLRAIYAIRSGSVKTYVLTNDGRMQITGFHIAGELLGLGAIAAKYFTSEARVMETTMVCEVPLDVLEEYSEEIPTIRQQMLKIMSQEILDNQELMLLLGKKNADERLATFLLSISRRFQRRNYSPTKFNLSMSRSDIGNYLGIAEETVCRVFTRFQNEGLLATERRQVQLHDLDRLNKIARG
jgi:CRP/FNR family transcriptional regulator